MILLSNLFQFYHCTPTTACAFEREIQKDQECSAENPTVTAARLHSDPLQGLEKQTDPRGDREGAAVVQVERPEDNIRRRGVLVRRRPRLACREVD